MLRQYIFALNNVASCPWIQSFRFHLFQAGLYLFTCPDYLTYLSLNCNKEKIFLLPQLLYSEMNNLNVTIGQLRPGFEEGIFQENSMVSAKVAF